MLAQVVARIVAKELAKEVVKQDAPVLVRGIVDKRILGGSSDGESPCLVLRGGDCYGRSKDKDCNLNFDTSLQLGMYILL